MIKKEFVFAYGDDLNIITDWLESLMENDTSGNIFKKIQISYEDVDDYENTYTFEA